MVDNSQNLSLVLRINLGGSRMNESKVTWCFIQNTLNKLDEDITELNRAIEEVANFDLPKKILNQKRGELLKERDLIRDKVAPASGV